MVQIHSSVQEAKRKANPQAALQQAVEKALSRIKGKFLVMSGKGGVGKSTTAVNLALALAAEGRRVGLMDVDLHGPDIARMLGLAGVCELTAERMLKPMAYSDNLLAISVESLTPDKDHAVIWRGPVKFSAIQQFIGTVDWGPLDALIIDAPPGTGDEPLTVAQTIKDAQAVVVTTPQEVSLADVRKSINFCRTVKLPIFGLVENMSGLVCPHCRCELELFGSGGGRACAEQVGIPFLGAVPFDPRMVTCTDAGASYLELYPDSPVTEAYTAVARKMIQAVDGRR